MPDPPHVDGRRRPRVLWVTALPPDHNGGGGHMRQAYLLDALTSVADVHLMVAGRVDDEDVRHAVTALTQVGPGLPELRTPPMWRRRLGDVRMAVFARDSREAEAHRSVRRDLVRVVTEHAPRADLVIVQFAGLAPLVRDRIGPPWWLDLHNVGSTMADHQAALVTGRRRWLYQREAMKARRFEASVVAAFDRVIVAGEDDCAAITPGTTTLVPNGVDTTRYRVTPLPDRPVLLFSGALYTGPNQDGVRWLLTDILPRVREQLPAVEVEIVGAKPPSWMEELAADYGVGLYRDVPDMTPYVQRCRVSIVPLRIGSGTRLKALEALSAGRPVVGTSVGLAGLGLVDGRDASIADDAGKLAAAVVRLMQDDDLARRRVADGQRVADLHDWRRIGASFATMVLEATETRAGHSC